MGWAAAVCMCSPAIGQEQDAADSVLCRMGASAGARWYRPGEWSLVEVYTINPTDEPAEARAVMRFSDDPTLQFGRQVFVPPRSNLRTTCPVYVPDFIGKKFSVDFVAEQVEPPPQTTRSQHEALLAPQSRLLNHDPITVGMISDLQTEAPENNPAYFTVDEFGAPPRDQDVYDLVLAAKRARRLSRKISEFKPSEMPADPAGLDIVDTIVLSSDGLVFDPGGITVLRDWVLSGGNLWITLDSVHTDTVAAVMGAAFECTVIDTVELTEAKIRSVRSDLRYRRNDTFYFDQPVKFVRVIPRGVNVIDMIGKWPAAFWQPFGEGRIYFTAAGPGAWMRPTRATDPQPITEDDVTPFFPREPMRYFAQECLAPRPAPRISDNALRPYLSEQIGYRIVDRRNVAAILGAFCGCLAIASVVTFRRGQSGHILWLTPLAVLVASAIFIVIATNTKQAVPPTAATVAHLVLEPGVSTAHSYGLAAMYNRDTSSEELGTSQGGVLFPDMSSISGRRRRVTWTDEGNWRWESLELPPGLRTASFKRSLPLESAADCRAKFGPNGLEGNLGPLPFSDFEDAIIAIPRQPSLSVKFSEDSTQFSSTPGDLLSSGTYVSDSLLSADQRRRTAVYEHLFREGTEESRRQGPMLHAWASVADIGFEFPQETQFGSTLISTPIRLEPSPPGSQVSIPAPFLPYRAINGPDGRQPTAYGNRMHQWLETRDPALDWLRFQLPESVLPIQLERAELTINIRAPSRTLQVLVPTAAGPAVVTEISRPIGTYSAVLDKPEWLELDERGGLIVVIRVGQDEAATSADSMQYAPWKIGSLHLEVAGTVIGDGDGS